MLLLTWGSHLTWMVLSGPRRAAKEMYRVLKPGGVAIVTTWYQRNFEKALEATIRTIRPNEEPFT